MTHEMRILAICYRLLSRLDRTSQIAAVDYLKARLDSDNEKILRQRSGRRIVWRGHVRKAGGDALLSALEMILATGAKSGQRVIDLPGGPISAHAIVNVEKVEAP